MANHYRMKCETGKVGAKFDRQNASLFRKFIRLFGFK